RGLSLSKPPDPGATGPFDKLRDLRRDTLNDLERAVARATP
ncbi:MAG: hypothetical protein K0S70_4252, partial [Microbacterium sp.]|nr:hypothetical protein [Microbacterium sp.]